MGYVAIWSKRFGRYGELHDISFTTIAHYKYWCIFYHNNECNNIPTTRKSIKDQPCPNDRLNK